jgi:hypothetical protein
MGLPDDYSVSGRYNQKAKTIRNMVPPFMMEALAKSLYEKVILPYRRKPGTKYITAKTDYGEKKTLRLGFLSLFRVIYFYISSKKRMETV